jgi:tripartite-type tricarboxylate transporter receptor subunit TctC
MLALTTTLSVAATISFADQAKAEYPDQAVTILSTSSPGSGGDIIVRFYAKKLEDLTKQTFIVESKPGANGHIGTQTLMRSKPDGYTLLLNGASFVVGNTFIMKAADYNPITDLQAVSGLFQLGVVLITGANSENKTVTDLVNYLKKKNGDSTYGMTNVSNQITAAMLLSATGTSAKPVQYKAPQQTADDLFANMVDFGFADTPGSIAQEKAGRIKILAVTTADRVPAAPQIPTMMEAGIPGFEYSVIWGSWFPKSTPPEIVKKMNALITKVNEDPETKEFLKNQGANSLVTPTPEDASAAVKKFYDNWAQMTAKMNIVKQ